MKISQDLTNYVRILDQTDNLHLRAASWTEVYPIFKTKNVAYIGGQKEILKPGQATYYSVAFSVGLFITIAVIGIICALLGRMLGNVGNYWQILVGLVLLWVALGMFGVEQCSVSGSLLYRLNLKGIFGAFALGIYFIINPFLSA